MKKYKINVLENKIKWENSYCWGQNKTPKSPSSLWKIPLKTTNISLFSSTESKNLACSCDRDNTSKIKVARGSRSLLWMSLLSGLAPNWGLKPLRASQDSASGVIVTATSEGCTGSVCMGCTGSWCMGCMGSWCMGCIGSGCMGCIGSGYMGCIESGCMGSGCIGGEFRGEDGYLNYWKKRIKCPIKVLPLALSSALTLEICTLHIDCTDSRLRGLNMMTSSMRFTNSNEKNLFTNSNVRSLMTSSLFSSFTMS